MNRMDLYRIQNLSGWCDKADSAELSCIANKPLQRADANAVTAACVNAPSCIQRPNFQAVRLSLCSGSGASGVCVCVCEG